MDPRDVSQQPSNEYLDHPMHHLGIIGHDGVEGIFLDSVQLCVFECGDRSGAQCGVQEKQLTDDLARADPSAPRPPTEDVPAQPRRDSRSIRQIRAAIPSTPTRRRSTITSSSIHAG